MLPKSEYDFLMKKPIIEILDGDACLDNLISDDKIIYGISADPGSSLVTGSAIF